MVDLCLTMPIQRRNCNPSSPPAASSRAFCGDLKAKSPTDSPEEPLLLMRSISNRKIFTGYFWEHAQFGWRSPNGNFNRFKFYYGYRDLMSMLTKRSLQKMANPMERDCLFALLVQKYGSDLFPSPYQLGFNNDESANNNVGSWQDAFLNFTRLFGKDVGINLRTGRDLKQYRKQEHLLQEQIRWKQFEPFTLEEVRMDSTPPMTVHFQEFPRQHLYRLEIAKVKSLEVDDWPMEWVIEG